VLWQWCGAAEGGSTTSGFAEQPNPAPSGHAKSCCTHCAAFKQRPPRRRACR
jgi:hypothetical protein